MAKTIFRKKQVDQITSPEQLNEYIHVPGVGNWMFVLGISVLVVSLLVWGAFGSVSTVVESEGVLKDGKIVCFLSEEQVQKVQSGMKVETDEINGLVETIGEIPMSDEEVKEYLASDYFYEALPISNWNYQVVIRVDETAKLQSGRMPSKVMPLSIETGLEKPIDFMLEQ